MYRSRLGGVVDLLMVSYMSWWCRSRLGGVEDVFMVASDLVVP